MAEGLKKSRKSNFSQDEIDILVSAIIRNYDLLYGEFSKRAFYKHERHKVWLDIVKAINKISPEKRTLDEVKNKWKKCQHLYRLSDLEMDAMPLEKRLRAPTPTVSSSTTPPQPEPVLQSQPLSPTKLKVTRQAARPGGTAQQSPRPTPPPPTPPPPPPQDVCLRWNTHHANMQITFPSLLMKEQYVDATLVAEGQTIKCHRVILSSCSPYFEDVLSSISPYQHPVLFMKDVPFWILRSVCDFMYSGEVNVAHNELEEFLAVADNLKIKGLARTIDFPPIQEVKKEPDMKPIKEEQKEEKREEREKEMKDTKESKETIKEIKDKKDKDMKEKKEKKEKDCDVIQTKQRVKKRNHLPIPVADMPVLKSAKLLRSTPHSRQNLEMPVLKTVLKPSKTKAVFVAKKSDKVDKLDTLERKVDKLDKKTERPEKTVTFAPQKHPKESPSTSMIFDPMNLLKPVYEEVTNEMKIQCSPVRIKEPKQKTIQKKIKKRKNAEERDESPPPVLSRKGTRSRPNRKMAKFYHSPYEQNSNLLEPLSESSTIVVREPHANQQPERQQESQTEHQDQPMESQMDQADPLMQMEHIKDEPVDMEENSIDIVENVVSYEMQMHEEEIMENYDIKSISKSVKIVNVADIKGIKVVDPFTFNQDTSNITIRSIHSLMEKEDISTNQLGFKISSVVSTADASKEKSTEQNCKEMGFKIDSVVSDPTADIEPKVEVESIGTLTEESLDSISEALSEKASETALSASGALQDKPKIEDCDSTEGEEVHAIEGINEFGLIIPTSQCRGSQIQTQNSYCEKDMRKRNIVSSQGIDSSHLGNISHFIKKEEEESLEMPVHVEIGPNVSHEQVSRGKGDNQDSSSCDTAGRPIVSKDNEHICQEAGAEFQPDDLYKQSGIEVSNEFRESDPKLIDDLLPDNMYLHIETAITKDTEKHKEVMHKLAEKNEKGTEEDKEAPNQDGGEEIWVGTVPTQFGTEDGRPEENLLTVSNQPKETTDERTTDTPLEKQEHITAQKETKLDSSAGISELNFESTITKHEKLLNDIDESHLDKQDGQYMINPYLTEVSDACNLVDPELTKGETDLSNESRSENYAEKFKTHQAEQSNKECELVINEDDSGRQSVSHKIELCPAHHSSQPDKETDSYKSADPEAAVNREHLNEEQSENYEERLETSKSEQFYEEYEPVIFEGDRGKSSVSHKIETDLSNSSSQSEYFVSPQKTDSKYTTGFLVGDRKTDAPSTQNQETESTITERIGKESVKDVLMKSYKNESNPDEVIDLSDQSLQEVPLIEENQELLEGAVEETIHHPCQEIDSVVSNNPEAMDVEQIGDLSSINIERLVDQAMVDIPGTQRPMNDPSDIVDDSSETIEVSLEILGKFEDDKGTGLPPRISQDVRSTEEDELCDNPCEFKSTSDIIGCDEVCNVISNDLEDARKTDILSYDSHHTAAIPPDDDQTEALNQSSNLQPEMAQIGYASETSDVRTGAPKQNVCDMFENFKVQQSLLAAEKHANISSVVPNSSQDEKIPKQYTRCSESLDSCSSSFDVHDGFEGRKRAEAEGCNTDKVQQGEVRTLTLTALSESQESEVNTTSPSEPVQTIDFNAPGFHIAQVVNQQIALNEEHRSCSANPNCDNVVKGSSDLESIVNDLTMIVGEDQSQPDETSELIEDTNVIAESLENLLEK